MFDRKLLEAGAAPDFAVSFHYWGPMLIQAELEFDDGQKARAYVYARLPDSTTRRSDQESYHLPPGRLA